MGILSRSLGIQAFSLEDPAQPLLPPSALMESLGLGRSDAGVMVNEKMAMRLTTAYACIKIISQDLSRLSFDIFQQMPDDSLRIAKEHRCYSLLHDRPNANMSSMVWRGAMIASICAYGNAYSYIKRDKAARVIALVPLEPTKTSPVSVNGKLLYATTQTDNGQATYIEQENVLHFMGLSMDGIVGMSPIQSCKNAFGLGLAAEKFGSLFFNNGARATGVLSHPQHLDVESYENLKKSVHEWANGEQALRPIILEEGMKWEQITIPPNDAQFIETRKYQKEEIASLFRVPLHLLQDLSKSTNNNIEHQGLDYVRFCLSPIAVSMEQEINYKILGNNYLCEFNFLDLERGDFASQTTGLLALRNGGVYSANDVLRALRQNPIPEDEGGNVRIVQGAFIPLDSLLLEEGKPAVPETAETDTNQGSPAARKRTILSSYRPLFRDAVGRTITRGNDAEFVKKAFQPAVNSLYQTMLASKFGNAELTRADLDKIGAVVDGIAKDAATWNKSDASKIATELVARVYEELYIK